MGSHSYDNTDRSDRQFWHMVGAVLLFMAALILACGLTGCSPVKRMGGIAAKHPDAALTVCSNMFPPKVETVTNTEYKQGQTVYDTAMVFVDCDSVIAMAKDNGLDGKTMVQTKLVRVKCPPSMVRVDTMVITVTITKTDTKAEKLLVKANIRADDNEAKSKSWRKKALWGWGILAGLGVFAIVKLYLKFKPF